MSHPHWTLANSQIIFTWKFVIWTWDICQVGNRICFRDTFLKDDPFEYSLILIFRVCAFVHQVIVIFINIKKSNKVWVEDSLEHIFTINTVDILNILLS